jgi:trimethylamine--corrinoid protein Co-methyltransferase
MAKYLNMPSAAGGVGSNAKTPGVQSTLENSMLALRSTMAAQEINNGIGLLDCSTVLSYEQMIIDDEIVGRALACGREIPVTKETINLDLIRQVGILGIGPKKGSYLGERSTMLEVRKFHQSSLFSGEPFEQWEAKGKKDELTLAKEKADWILKNHEPSRLDRDISDRLRRLIGEAAR